MSQFASRFWLLSAVVAMASCGPGGGGTSAGTDAGGGAGASGTGGTDAAQAPEAGSGGAGGVSGTGGVSGAGGALPPSRCSFNSGVDGPAAAAPATEMVVLRRLARFLDDASSPPAGVTASATTPATAAFATAAATRILDDHVAKGTEAAGLVRFLVTWLKLPMGNAPAHTWSRTLLAANATLNSLFTAPTADAHRSGVFTDRALLTARTAISSRGQWLAENVFCVSPFGDVGMMHLGVPADTTPGITRRQRLAKEMAPFGNGCVGCHNQIDPPGFALEHFDEMGAYRDQDNGRPVDSAGKLLPPLPALSFTSIDDLAPQLAMSCVVDYCFANGLLTDALAAAAADLAMPPAPAFSRSEADRVATAFVNANLSVRALVGAIVSTPSFLRGP